jgi:hypothetical protein
MTGRVIVLATVAMAIVAIGTTMDQAMTPRFVWNASASVPIGLYKAHPALTVTALTVAYPPEPLARWLAEGRYLPRGVPLLKPILAPDGQTVFRCGPFRARLSRVHRPSRVGALINLEFVVVAAHGSLWYCCMAGAEKSLEKSSFLSASGAADRRAKPWPSFPRGVGLSERH